MTRLNRAEAVAQVGEKAVLEVEGECVDFTGRVTGNDWVEFSATVDAFTSDESVKLIMYVLVSQDELNNCEEFDCVNWEKAISEAEFQIV